MGQVAFFVAHISLLSEDGKRDRSIVFVPQQSLDNSQSHEYNLATSREIKTVFIESQDKQAAHLNDISPNTLNSNDFISNMNLSTNKSRFISPLHHYSPDLQANTQHFSYPDICTSKLNSNIQSIGSYSQNFEPQQLPVTSYTTFNHYLFGSLVSQSYLLGDVNGIKGAYFIFPQISVRIQGIFRLEAVVLDLRRYYYL